MSTFAWSPLDYSYIIKNTTPNTDYQIKVRVMNKFGEAEDFGYANIKTLTKQDDYKQKEKDRELERAKDELRQKGTQKIVGDKLQYTVGTLENVIPLAGYTTVKEKQVRIPISQIKLAPNASIEIKDTNMNLIVPFSAFNIPQVEQTGNDSVVAITIVNMDGRVDEKVSTLLRRTGEKRGSRVHQIKLELVEPKRTTPINATQKNLTMAIFSNTGNSGSLSQYDPNNNRIIKNINPNINKGGYYVQITR